MKTNRIVIRLALAVLFLGNCFGAVCAEESNELKWAEENIQAGRYAEALTQLIKAIDAAKPNTPAKGEIVFKLASVMRITGKYDEGIKLTEEASKGDYPNLKAINCLRGELLTEVGRYADAVKVFDALIAQDGKYHRAWAMRQQAGIALGDKELSKKTADYFFDLYQKNTDYYNSDKVADPMDLAYIGLGLQDENPKDAFEVGFMLAEGLFEARKEFNAEAVLWTADLAFNKYNFAEAASRYQAALKARPNLPDAAVGLAKVILEVKHDVKQVETLLQKALEVNPKHVDALLTLAEIDVQEDKMKEAKEYCERALAVNPNSVQALAMQAFYHHDLKELDKEAAVEKKVLELFPKSAEYYCRVGELIESKRGFEEAPAYYRKAMALDPAYWRSMYLLGMNTSRIGASGEMEGKKLLQAAFKKNKFNVWAANMILVLKKMVGEEAEDYKPEYVETKTKHFTIKIHERDAPILTPYVEEWAEAAYERQKALFGFEPKGPLTITLCATFTDQAARTVGLPNLGALGVCFGKFCTVVSPNESRREKHPPFNWRKVLEHEFGHVMTLQMSEYRVPRWYTEAFSTFIEDDSRIGSDHMMIDAIAKDQLKPIEKLNEYFRENMLMAYVHGRYVIEYIDKLGGWEAHRKALKMFAEGKKPEEVLPAVTGKSLAELNEGQFKFVKDYFQNVRLRPTYDQADIAKLEAAAQTQGAPAKALADLAIFYLNQRKFPRAEALAKKALETDANYVDAINVMGVIAYEKKDYESAKERFAKSTSIDSDRSFMAWHRLGMIYKKEGRTTKAIEALETARKLYPRYVGDENPYYVLPELYLDMEPPQEEKAMQVWRDAVKVNTEDPKAAEEGMKMAIELKDWKSAAFFGEAHVEVDPYKKEVHMKLGRVFEELKEPAKAAREYQVATAIDEKDVDAFVKLAKLRLALGQREEAIRALNAALDIDATHAGAKALKAEMGL